MCRSTTTLLVLCLLMPGCNQGPESAPEADWQLPVHLGDSETRVYEVLGRPSRFVESPPNGVGWFKESGLSITFDSSKSVSQITIHGPWNNRYFQTYREPVMYGLRVTDKIVHFFDRLGRPVQKKRTWHESELSFVWQRTSLLIEVTYWTKTTELRVPRRLVNFGEVSRIDISMAPGSQEVTPPKMLAPGSSVSAAQIVPGW
jgi:hypothetical protein